MCACVSVLCKPQRISAWWPDGGPLTSAVLPLGSELRTICSQRATSPPPDTRNPSSVQSDQKCTLLLSERSDKLRHMLLDKRLYSKNCCCLCVAGWSGALIALPLSVQRHIITLSADNVMPENLFFWNSCHDLHHQDTNIITDWDTALTMVKVLGIASLFLCFIYICISLITYEQVKMN